MSTSEREREEFASSRKTSTEPLNATIRAQTRERGVNNSVFASDRVVLYSPRRNIDGDNNVLYIQLWSSNVKGQREYLTNLGL